MLFRFLTLIFVFQILKFLTPDEYLNLEIEEIEHANKN